MTPLRTGFAIAATVGVFYVLCTLVWVFAPGPFLAFMDALFHGMDFSAMVQPRAFLPARFAAALVVLVAWAFCAGVFYGWLLAHLTPRPSGLARSTP